MDTQTQEVNKHQPKIEGFKRILVAIDQESSTLDVLEKAIKLAKSYNSNLMIFHSVDEKIPIGQDFITSAKMGIYGGMYIPEIISIKQKTLEQTLEQTREQIVEWLSSCCQKAKTRGISTEFDYNIGPAGEAICRIATTWKADLIVIGRRGRSGLSELLLGSVSNYVLHHVHCSVLVVHQ